MAAEATFAALVAATVSAMRSAPGNLWADAARAEDDDPSTIVVSEWRTAADLDAWEASEAAQRFSDDVDPSLREDGTRRRFTST